jgi:fructosamine-3-kinase
MSAEVQRSLSEALGTQVLKLRSVHGGDINDAYRAELADGRSVFVKTREGAPQGMYQSEAAGLHWLEAARALRVPNVLAVNDALLALEWIEAGRRRPDFDEILGRGLATLHRAGPEFFGLDQDNFIGPLPQNNAPRGDWPSFYREQRLLPLLNRASAMGLLERALRSRFEQLFRELPSLVGPPETPARLHGDLWSGNVHVDAGGAPVLIDPAAYGGHREVDLAMLQLFGAPSQRFFAAYDEVYPLAPGFAERVPLYQLYPLLVHLCLFGAAYRGQLEQALDSALADKK